MEKLLLEQTSQDAGFTVGGDSRGKRHPEEHVGRFATIASLTPVSVPSDVTGPFQTLVIGMPMFGLQFDQGDNGIFILSVTKGPGAGTGVYRGPTNTKVIWDSNSIPSAR